MSFEDIETAFAAQLQRFGNLGSKAKFDFGPEGRLWVDGTQKPAVMNHSDADADCVISCTTEDFQNVIKGKLDPTLAFTTGKIKIKGSTAVAMRIASQLKGLR